MRKLVIILLLSVNSIFAQTSIPSSGAISMSQIATVMYNLGEITSGELTGEYQIAFLNNRSHLSDQTAPYALSDWYGYTGTPAVTGHNFAAYTTNSGTICGASNANTQYSASATLGVGAVLYSNMALTTPSPAGYYKKLDGTGYWAVIGSGGYVGGSGPCP